MARVTTLTSMGQATIPNDIRDELGLKPHDKIRFSLVNGRVTLQKAYLPLKEIAGSIPAINVPMEEWDEIIQDEIAQCYAKKFL
ncbi:MAG TPA: hypothetical protein VHG52_02450 [Thermomicrobiales bacterium]|nr:hypothetical protein [Thermomicrobiales bacterium]